jgi:hypothetical protein
MTTSRHTKRAALVATVAALAFAAPATATDSEYVPFVTDFPKPAVPLEVPAAPVGPTPIAADDGFAWGSAAAGAGAGLGVAVLIGLGMALRTRRTAVA